MVLSAIWLTGDGVSSFCLCSSLLPEYQCFLWVNMLLLPLHLFIVIKKIQISLTMNIYPHSHKTMISKPVVEFPQPGGRSPKYHKNFPIKFFFLFGDLAPNFASILEARCKPPDLLIWKYSLGFPLTYCINCVFQLKKYIGLSKSLPKVLFGRPISIINQI